jgi:hypothetical protein
MNSAAMPQRSSARGRVGPQVDPHPERPHDLRGLCCRSRHSVSHFHNSFQMMDLWNSGIPTLEEYGQWVSKQLYAFDRDLLAQKQEDRVDPLQSSILLYRFRPLLLRAPGVRFVIVDGTLANPLTEFVTMDSGQGRASVNLYEIRAPILGNSVQRRKALLVLPVQFSHCWQIERR